MPEQSSDYRVAVFGAGGVGKSLLVLRLEKAHFGRATSPLWKTRTGRSSVVTRKHLHREITDTTGSHQFPKYAAAIHLQRARFILVYSITSRQSLEEPALIYEQICRSKGTWRASPLALVGNKCDESPNRGWRAVRLMCCT